MDLSDCLKLELMPQGLFVGANAVLNRTLIKSLPEKTIIKDGLIVDGCRNLTEIHDGVSCDWISAVGASSLSRIPGERVYSDLLLSGTSITEIPDGVCVGRNLELENCKWLTRIAEGTTVKRYVNLQGCHGIFKLPKSLQPPELDIDAFQIGRSSIFMPCIQSDDAEMMVGRPAHDVIRHHLLENLDVMKETIEHIQPPESVLDRDHPSSVWLDTAERRQLRRHYAERQRLKKRR
jgi:hypothetical protein